MIKNKKDFKFYRVDNFKGNLAFLVPSTFTLSELIKKVQAEQAYKQFQIFLDSQILETSDKQLHLEQIVKLRYAKSSNPPTFYVFEFPQAEAESEEMKEYYESISELLRLEGSAKQEWTGANGHVLFEGRNNSLIASSYTKAASLHRSNSKYSLNISEALLEGEKQQEGKKDKTISEEIKEVKKLIAYMKQNKTKQEFLSYKSKQVVSKKYSNFDLNFVTSLEKTYLQYSLRSGRKLSYIDYRELSFGVIQRKLTKTDIIGIIGDYGTGLEDSYELMENMVMGCGVNVILHLGDVYYAGTPEEYQNNVTAFIKRLRGKSKKQILFYSIPGNHDYYSWGMPFLCFIKGINDQEFTKQRASYFCLRTEDNKWQFLGADTAYHDSNPFDQINQTNPGPRLRQQELKWHRDKLDNFQGSTIFLTHHQLFSIHDRLCGSLSIYRYFSCINPMISKQLFEYMPYFSAWYWGHEHAFMMFRENFWGVPRCRLLGNSSFHVIFQKQHPYHRKPTFPKIPFIAEDEVYLKKFLPLNLKESSETYFNLSFAVIDMVHSQENLLVQYYCSPCYNNSSKKMRHFKYYKLHEQVIESKSNIINNSHPIKRNERFFLKNEVGLLLDYKEGNFQLNFNGTGIVIVPLKQQDHLQDMMRVYLRIDSKNPQFLTSLNEKVTIDSQPTQHSVWTFKKSTLMQNNTKITYLNTFIIRNEFQMKFLNFTVHLGTPNISLTKELSNWQCLRPETVILPD